MSHETFARASLKCVSIFHDNDSLNSCGSLSPSRTVCHCRDKVPLFLSLPAPSCPYSTQHKQASHWGFGRSWECSLPPCFLVRSAYLQGGKTLKGQLHPRAKRPVTVSHWMSDQLNLRSQMGSLLLQKTWVILSKSAFLTLFWFSSPCVLWLSLLVQKFVKGTVSCWVPQL